MYDIIIIHYTVLYTNTLHCCIFQHEPPVRVNDLCQDIQSGVVLLKLLEVLSGEKLVRFMSFYIF